MKHPISITTTTVLCYLAVIVSVVNAQILVTGATGRTGSLLYKKLQQLGGHVEIRALVRDTTKASEILNCHHCDESEGIFVGDVRNMTTLLPAFQGIQTVAIVTGVSGGRHSSDEDIEAIEFLGVQNQIKALAQELNLDQVGLRNLRVVLCSSMGTTRPSTGMFGNILFYKLNAEVFLGSCGIPSTIVKPCGLLDHDTAGNGTLVASHDDDASIGSRAIAREYVAQVMAEAVIRRPRDNLRFDLCAIHGPPTTDYGALLDSSRWEWEEGTTSEE